MTSRPQLVRRISAVLLLVWVGFVVASFLRRQGDRKAPTGQVEFAGGGDAGAEQPVRVHRGFVYTDTIGVEPNFRIAAKETVEFASGWFELSDVDVSLYRGGEAAFALTSQRARLHRDRREAIATGDVRLSLAGGVVVSAAGVSLKGEERILESHGPATFAGESIGGLAGGMVFRVEDNSLELTGGVSFVWRPRGEDGAEPLIVLAPRAEYSRATASVTFPEGATLLRGPMRLHGAAMLVQLREAEGAIDISLAAPVEIDGTTAAGVVLTGRAGSTELRSTEDGRLRLAAEPASDTGWVSVLLRDPEVGWREMRAWRLVGEGSREAWEWVEAQGLACVTDLVQGAEASALEAERVHIDLRDGRAESAVAEGNVRIEGAGQWAEGDRLVFSVSSQTFSLTPAAGRRVSVGTPDVTCVCDVLESADGGNVSARGNVGGVLQRGALWGAGDAPMRFAADSALVANTGARLELNGQARLWQGDKLVRADSIEFIRADEAVTAVGNVVTLARMPARGDAAGDLMQLRARSLHYEHQGGLAVYEGDVVLEDARSTATCQRLNVTLGSDGQVLLATLDGGVSVAERGTGRVIKGQRARIDAARDVLEMWGTPLLIQEGTGNQVKGSRLEWRRATETLVVFGSDDAPSETIYQSSGAAPAAATTPPTARQP